MKNRYIRLSLLILLYSASLITYAEEPVNLYRISKIAIGGYSAVAYHHKGQAVKGDKQYAYRWKGAKWLFSPTSVELDFFAADPDYYAPAYNGFCADALSQDDGLVKTNGKHWRIIDDRLYLFRSETARKRWETNKKEYIQQANVAWKKEISKWAYATVYLP